MAQQEQGMKPANTFFTVIALIFFITNNVVYGDQSERPFVYHQSRDILQSLKDSPPPKRGETRVDPDTNVRITRLSDVSDLSRTSDALIVYSRYSPENSSGQYVLIFGSDSHSSWVLDRNSGKVLRELRDARDQRIGEEHEVRWDYSGKHPHRVYFRVGLAFFMIDDVSRNSDATLIKDFQPLFKRADRVYNDVEGDSSNDSDHWAFMASYYDRGQYRVEGFVHYHVSSGQTHVLRPADLADTPLAHYRNEHYFERPNMVEVSPLATGVVLHYGRSYPEERYHERPRDVGTWFDGPHLWPLDFNVKKSTPIKIADDETHSGWVFDNAGVEYFVSQNSRTDWFDAVALSGSRKGIANKREFARHADFGWSNGFHFGKMPPATPGWALVSTYSHENDKNHHRDWGADQLVMVKLDSLAVRPSIWRLGASNNRYAGDYRDEAPAAINLFGNRVYLASNWFGKLGHREVFVYELPDQWWPTLR